VIGMASKRGSKKSYTNKQKRQAEHIAEGYTKKGVSKKTAKARAYATVNKQDGGGKKSGSGRGKKRTAASAKRGAKKAAATRRSKKRSSKR